MKKVVLILLCIGILTGCSTLKKEQEYSVEEFSEIDSSIASYAFTEFFKLTTEEQYGNSDDDMEKNEFAKSVNIKFMKEKMKEYGLKFNEPIKIRGRVYSDVDKDSTLLNLGPLDAGSDARGVTIRMDEDISELEKGEVVVVEAEYLEEFNLYPLGNGKIISK